MNYSANLIPVITFLAAILGFATNQDSASEKKTENAFPNAEVQLGNGTKYPVRGPDLYERTQRDLSQFDDQHGAVYEGGRVPIHYLQWESDKGVPLILLHGTYNTAHEFVPFAKQLQDAGFRPIAVEWYGHGKTPIPDEEVSIRDFAEDLAGLMNSLEIEAAVLAGHSRGGMICTAFYESFPEHTLGLILIDGGSTSPTNYFSSLGAEGLKTWMSEAFDPQTGESKAPSYANQQELFLEKWNQLGRPAETDKMFEVLAQSSEREDGRWTQWRPSIRHWLMQDNLENTFNGMFRPEESPRFIASCTLLKPREVYRRLRVPLLILDAAGRDKKYRDPTPGIENALLRDDHPKLVQVIEYDSGHYLHREQPDRFLKDVVSILDRIKD